jgi:hypothetical protein
MLRNTLTTDNTIESDIAFLENQYEMTLEIAYEAKDEIEPFALDELSHEPPPAKKPIRWTSDKQRIAVMIKLKKENNLPYRRTHKLAKAWKMYLREFTEGSFGIVFENPSKIGKFVGGSLAQNPTAALRFKQGFHDDTGWQDYGRTVTFWLDATEDRFIEKLDQRFAEQANVKTRRRAYTSGTKR